MRASAQKQHPDWSGIGFVSGKDYRGYSWPGDRATHERKVEGRRPNELGATPLKFITAIEASRRLLELGPDWDDDGAKAIDYATWRIATEFLKKTVAKSGIGAMMPVPHISPCRDGSIDLFWATAVFRLLINIKSSTDLLSDYYGETDDHLVIKGTFDPGSHDLSVVLKLLLSNKV